MNLVKMSLKSAVGKFEGRWNRQKKGIPTGGSLCVELANITVFYIMRKSVYADKNLMKHVVHVKRYIDDGAGFFTGSKRQFESWLKNVNQSLSVYGLLIDESAFEETGICVPFLDIRFWTLMASYLLIFISNLQTLDHICILVQPIRIMCIAE